MESLKDGVILCDLINKLQPGSVKKVNESTQNWHQLENIGNFIKAITKYGVKPHDIFEANDLFENTNHTQVQTTLIALASMAKTKGNKVNIGVKYAEKQQRKFMPEKLKEGRNIIGLQMGTNKFASQQGMTAYGTRRHLYDPKLGTEQPIDQATISLQMGTNKGASQAGMTAPGTKRQIFDPTLGMEHCDTQNISLQMGSNKGASQQGMTVYGLPRQVYDSKYCLTPNYPIIGEDEDQYNHSHHNFYNSE
nr:calponin-1 isoform X1 [Pogona vitticeps]